MITMTALLLKLTLVTAPVASTNLEFPEATESGSEYASVPLIAAPVEIVRIPMLVAAPVEIVRVPILRAAPVEIVRLPLDGGATVASSARPDHR
jgi:hypothetical protein